MEGEDQLPLVGEGCEAFVAGQWRSTGHRVRRCDVDPDREVAGGGRMPSPQPHFKAAAASPCAKGGSAGMVEAGLGRPCSLASSQPDGDLWDRGNIRNL